MAKKDSLPGDGGAREEEVSSGVTQMEAAAEEAEIDASTLVGDIRDAMLEVIKHRPKPWLAMSSAEQRDVATAAEYAAKQMVGKAVDLVRSNGLSTPIKAILQTYAEAKDGTTKVSLQVKTFTEEEAAAAVMQLHRARGKFVLITLASPDEFSGERREAEIMADQPGLEFEGGTEGDSFGALVDQAEKNGFDPGQDPGAGSDQ